IAWPRRSWPVSHNRLDPLDDRPLHVVVHLVLGGSSSARDLEGMIAAFDDVHRGPRCKAGHHSVELGRRPERVSTALNNQHGTTAVAKVCIAAFGGPTRRVQRITEQYEAIYWKCGVDCGNVRRDPSTHRLAADEQRFPCATNPLADRANDGLVTRVE